MDERISSYSEKMKKTYEYLEADYAAIRAGRANPHVLDKLRVDYYGRWGTSRCRKPASSRSRPGKNLW